MSEDPDFLNPYQKPEQNEETEMVESSEEEGHMTFLEHLDDLRGVMMKAAVVFVVAIMLVMLLFKQINGFLQIPIHEAMERNDITSGLVTTSPMGVFSFILQMGFLGGLGMASPFLLYFASAFIAPGLTTREKAILLPGSLSAILLFAMGATFSYLLLVPAALEVSIYLNLLMGFDIVWAADRYMSLLLWMVMGMGLAFEFPLVLVILIFVGILTQAQLKRYWKHSIIFFFILSAFITPTADPITQSLVAFPLFILYLGSIFVGGIVERRRLKQMAKEEAEWDEE